MFFKTDDGVKLNYHIYGSGRPIILIAGFGGYQEIWTAQVDYLTHMGYQVITYDHRNMGRSERTSKGHTLKRLTEDILELSAALDISSVALITHSMGSSILYNLLAVKPELIKLGIIIDQSPYMLNTADWPYGFMNYTPDNFVSEIKKTPQVHETINGISSQVAGKLSFVKVKYPFSRKSNLDLLRDHVQLDWREVIKREKRPLMVIAAKSSPYYDWHFGQWMKAQNDKIETVVLENTGHDIMAEVPQRTNQLIRHFLLKNRYLARE
ncbi:alpha/beta fold hydrolase [Lactobacillus ultunensis]|uniref:Hydrolase, alpha/beta domain protein n=1 Tax=Lactobacillus ultunensis DSM 16047 TaxID=525365 RepID=C2EL47_9LACO|nr:alpha/beta hydrolase [Lactobacillus ultunensis]EEJ72697.1 hydrolase, alpha/beta domain protein [Lactobacillus ultunensis DSM 16047]KRL81267.1 alpha beta fold family hydrolase [Lactobacillus ultunensis DSM 16047]QQP29078.1 alpha/beta hydrolase [Lactobacillus ultunensis]